MLRTLPLPIILSLAVLTGCGSTDPMPEVRALSAADIRAASRTPTWTPAADDEAFTQELRALLPFPEALDSVSVKGSAVTVVRTDPDVEEAYLVCVAARGLQVRRDWEVTPAVTIESPTGDLIAEARDGELCDPPPVIG